MKKYVAKNINIHGHITTTSNKPQAQTGKAQREHQTKNDKTMSLKKIVLSQKKSM